MADTLTPFDYSVFTRSAPKAEYGADAPAQTTYDWAFDLLKQGAATAGALPVLPAAASKPELSASSPMQQTTYAGAGQSLAQMNDAMNKSAQQGRAPGLGKILTAIGDHLSSDGQPQSFDAGNEFTREALGSPSFRGKVTPPSAGGQVPAGLGTPPTAETIRQNPAFMPFAPDQRPRVQMTNAPQTPGGVGGVQTPAGNGNVPPRATTPAKTGTSGGGYAPPATPAAPTTFINPADQVRVAEAEQALRNQEMPTRTTEPGAAPGANRVFDASLGAAGVLAKALAALSGNKDFQGLTAGIDDYAQSAILRSHQQALAEGKIYAEGPAGLSGQQRKDFAKEQQDTAARVMSEKNAAAQIQATKLSALLSSAQHQEQLGFQDRAGVAKMVQDFTFHSDNVKLQKQQIGLHAKQLDQQMQNMDRQERATMLAQAHQAVTAQNAGLKLEAEALKVHPGSMGGTDREKADYQLRMGDLAKKLQANNAQQEMLAKKFLSLGGVDAPELVAKPKSGLNSNILK